ncbi:MAG: MarC family protein [Elusimicrobiaceae bacterium]|nr:MarC family protein [Elusimicrobiaceae bacterium]
MSFLNPALTLFFIMDPLGNVPLFVAALEKVPPERRKRVIMRELWIALGMLLFFFLFGHMFLTLMSIKQGTLTIAGGMILFLIALKMIFPPAREDGFAENPGGEPFIVPLAVPLVVGPSSMSFVMIIANQNPQQFTSSLAAIAIAWAANVLILRQAFRINTLLGPKVMMAVTRLMGMLLCVMAVQMFLDGIQTFMAAK